MNKEFYYTGGGGLKIDTTIPLWYIALTIEYPYKHSYPERWRDRPCEASATYLLIDCGVVRIPADGVSGR
jgi:hypothetical protein